ncbi:MAG: dTDP-4-dehydrorhamnose 3,5-epimerase [Acidobacteriales bacterium]|nr:dTDP-4-dehydrorhamnose 3,5-epimerase [Terriglobales bacterium]
MKVIGTENPDVLLLEPQIFPDDRGFFFESYNCKVLASVGIEAKFVQDNHSKSHKNVLRGLHYQIQHPQGKLVRVVSGEVFDVAVDLRANSRTFGSWVGARLSAENRLMMWIPIGFAHGFLTLSESADVLYKATDYYAPESERTIAWNDEKLKINWPIQAQPIVSAKDGVGTRFRDAEVFE